MKPLDRALEHLKGVKAHNGYYMALCPAHGDRDPSLSVREGEDGRVLLKCFAGCAFDEMVTAMGLEAKDLYPNNATLRGGGGSYSPRNRETVKPEGCTLKAYSASKQLSVPFLKTLGVSEIPNYNAHPAVRIPYLNTEHG